MPVGEALKWQCHSFAHFLEKSSYLQEKLNSVAIFVYKKEKKTAVSINPNIFCST
jgi:hypothetical protein